MEKEIENAEIKVKEFKEMMNVYLWWVNCILNNCLNDKLFKYLQLFSMYSYWKSKWLELFPNG